MCPVLLPPHPKCRLPVVFSLLLHGPATYVSVALPRSCLASLSIACPGVWPHPASVTQLGLVMLTTLPQEFAATGSFPASNVSTPA